MDRLISEEAVLETIATWIKSSEPYDRKGWYLYDRVKAIPSVEPTVAQERYEDLCEYFGGAKDILNNREYFKAWLGRIKWHIRKAEELYEKYEQEPRYCDRNICLKNEYNGIGCDECEVTKSQEPKTGHWIKGAGMWICNQCGYEKTFGIATKFCSQCGARMVEPQEGAIRNDNSILRL